MKKKKTKKSKTKPKQKKKVGLNKIIKQKNLCQDVSKMILVFFLVITEKNIQYVFR
jgi:hypothetical protein